jgi:K(+)-stimulated pyrophosphate-energized sodium pump
MVLPGVLAIVVPVGVGFIGGAEMLGGLLAGVTTCGVLMAIFQSNAGGAWDNAKKMIEEQGKKGTDAHKAAVVGDTVGDPFKDTSGPSLNILLKLMSVVALVIAPSIAMDGAAVTAYVNAKAETNLVEVVVTEQGEASEETYTVNVTSESNKEMVVEVVVKDDETSIEAEAKE